MRPVALVLTLLLAASPFALAHREGGVAGTPKHYCEHPRERSVHDYGPPSTGLGVWALRDGSVGNCDEKDLLLETDGHAEYANGGAILLNCEVLCGPLIPGEGSLHCFGYRADHTHRAEVSVEDVLQKGGVTFYVAIDTDTPCGDNSVDRVVACVDRCDPGLPPGADGAWWVFVDGMQGHVYA